jgi:hypothetical protein|tara:strand:- start:224 stop:586 length:363 start_codon:yes stop_codon:yes gene_type:complete
MSIKLALLKSGEDIVADWRELVLNEGDDKVAAYLASYPYVVTINKTDIPHADEPAKVGLSYFPWMPLSKDTEIPVDPDWVVTMVDPIDEVKKSYEEKVNVIKERRNGDSPNNRDNTDSDN